MASLKKVVSSRTQNIMRHVLACKDNTSTRTNQCTAPTASNQHITNLECLAQKEEQSEVRCTVSNNENEAQVSTPLAEGVQPTITTKCIASVTPNQPVANVECVVQKEVQPEISTAVSNIENEAQDSSTLSEEMPEQNLFGSNTLLLPFENMDSMENDSAMGNINVVGAEFTISEEIDNFVENDLLFELEEIDQLDLNLNLINVANEENKTNKENANNENVLKETQVGNSDNQFDQENEEIPEENYPNVYPDDENTKTNKNERKRKKKSDPDTWEKNQIKKARMTGQSYVGYSRKKNNNDKYVVKKGSERKERKMGPECTSTACKKSKIKKCRFFNSNQRQQLFEKFWLLSWAEKAMMVSGLVSLSVPKQIKKKEKKIKSRKTATFTYHLHLDNNRVKVCKSFFLSTLGVNEWMVQNWVKKNSNEISSENEEANENEDDPAVVDPLANKKRKSKIIGPNERMDRLKKFFDDLPKMPSHYCRRSTQKQYLETNVESKANLYRLYVNQMKDEGKPYYSECVFHKLFDDLNLAIFQPRKDRCDICYGYETKNVDKDIWEKHIEEKDRARMEKETDKEKAEAKEIHCLTMDLQAVKCVPNIKASESYYKTKLACHNFTIYNLANNHCTNYWWNESEGDLCASVFANFIINYLSNHCLEPKLPIVIFSDGCGYQNRNVTLANALLRFAKNNDVEVSQKFLCKGHTQMECDSVHAAIERKLKGKDIFVPFQYVQLTKSARQNPEPYEVKYITHSFFSDFTILKEVKSIRPGLETSDPKVVDLKELKYTKEGLLYRLDFDSNFENIPERETRKSKHKNKPVNQDQEGGLPKLFKQRLPIKLRKWNDLQDLKGVIPPDFHSFYDALPKQCPALITKSPKQSKPDGKSTKQESQNHTSQKLNCAQASTQIFSENKLMNQKESKINPNQKSFHAQNTKSPKQSSRGNKVAKQKQSQIH